MGLERILQVLAYLFYIFSVLIMIMTAFMGFILWLPLLFIAIVLNAAYAKLRDRDSSSGSSSTIPSQRRCPNCGANSLTRDDFCTSCRKFASDSKADMSTVRTSITEQGTNCPNCGKKNTSDEKFCTNCGRFLEE